MSIEKHQITVGQIAVEVVRKNIKNLHLAVYPPFGRVRIAVPLHIDDEAARLAVITKMAWIKKRQQNFAAQERQTARDYVTGESVYFQGKRYRLNVIIGSTINIAVRKRGIIDLTIRPDMDASKREEIFKAWYRRELKAIIPQLIAKWQKIVGVEVDDWGVKLMRTRWGTCNIKAKRIWINLELAKKPAHCLEFIIVHEMVHLLERKHNDRFKALMDKYLPMWRMYREELNRAPLGYETWGY